MPRHHSVGALFLAFYEASGKASSKASLVVNLVVKLVHLPAVHKRGGKGTDTMVQLESGGCTSFTTRFTTIRAY